VPVPVRVLVPVRVPVPEPGTACYRCDSGSSGTEISVHVEIPDQEAHRLETQRDIIRRSVANLAELAASQAG
jgi:hypothetical protein